MTQDTKNRHKERKYIITLAGYDIDILKQRPKRTLFADDISYAVVTNIVEQVLKQDRKRRE